jgi:hypothetical protein
MARDFLAAHWHIQYRMNTKEAKRMAKRAEVFTVRDKTGAFLGTYRALTASAAIQKFVSDQAATASTFRKSQPAVVPTGMTAAVEPSPEWLHQQSEYAEETRMLDASQ